MISITKKIANYLYRQSSVNHKKRADINSQIHLIPTFLTSDTCQHYIDTFNSTETEQSPINTNEGSKVIESVRNNNRLIFDDGALADYLFSQLKPHLPLQQKNWFLSGLNERFRIYEYKQGQFFDWHSDSSYRKSNDEISYLTLLIYLNDTFTGGETCFQETEIKPNQGDILFFPHSITHCGNKVTSGIKYVLRTDVMYSRYP